MTASTSTSQAISELSASGAPSFAARLGTGEPTPGVGVLEDIDVYASVLWLTVLATALLSRPPLHDEEAVP